ncbi:MAG TPA: hypothetical protein VM661_11735 [Candidatus Sulfotelmatobacter sp.]|jgi:hypothetical protein|nr:hypothetical protein [Candidatus Sulfotelmatobacter sp.]
MFDATPFREDMLLPLDLRSKIAALATSVDALRQPNEPAFLAVGDVLFQVSGVLQTLEGDFTGLAARLQTDQGAAAGAALSGMVVKIEDVAGIAAETPQTLASIAYSANAGQQPLSVLAKIIHEVGALSVNARVEAAKVEISGVDFSVFTTEISRLGQMAGTTVASAEGRLAQLLLDIAEAQKSARTFNDSDGRELDLVYKRLTGCLSNLGDHQRLAGDVAAQVALQSRQIGERVASCIGELQINDLTSQRIEHIVQALRLLDKLFEADLSSSPELHWMQELDGERRQALLVSVCELQRRQLELAAEDFVGEVARLKANLAGLAADADAVLALALRLLGDAGDASFVETLRQNVGRAAELLEKYATASEHLFQIISKTSQGFELMAGDLADIQSLDTDLRLMGLNASLKCARLGSSGRALGVIAQELRSRSRGTEEITGAIAQLVSTAVGVSASLSQRSKTGHASALGLVESIAASTDSLNSLDTCLNEAVVAMEKGCSWAASLLIETADAFSVAETFVNGAGFLASSLLEIAESMEVSPELVASVQADIHALLAGHYTMASERAIHELFNEGEGEGGPNSEITGGGDASLDDFFL